MDQQASDNDDRTEIPLNQGFRLKGFTILPDQRLVISPSGEETKLENRVMSVLLELASHPRETLTEDHFMDTVWVGRVVTPQVLSRSISLVRSALGDSAEKSEFIRTIPNQGYELIVDVKPLQARRRLISRSVATALVGLLALAAAVVFYRQAADEPAKIAVIPFTTPEIQQLPIGGEQLTDHLIRALTDAEGVRVVPRLDTSAINPTAMSTQTIGDKLGADYLLSGTISLQEDRLFLTMTLTDTGLEADIWSERIEADQDDPALLERRSLQSLSDALTSELNLPALQSVSQPAEVSEAAYRTFLQARYQWDLRGARRLDAAIRLNREAIEQSPDFAEAHLALAQALAVKPFYTDEPVGESFQAADSSLVRVQTLTDRLDAETDALRGFMSMNRKRWADARLQLERALSADPDSPLAHYWYSQLLSIFGDHGTALREIQTAAALNPHSAVLNDRLALAYLWVNDLEHARRQYAVAIELGYLESTQVKPAVLLAVRSADWDSVRALLLRLGNSPTWVDAFVDGLIDPDRRADGAAVIEAAMAEGEIDRTFWFGIWVLHGDADRAFRDFDAGEKTQDIELLWAAEAAFLREDPRFPALIERIGMSDFVHPDFTAPAFAGARN
jgi:DNA-binding winged helix-turn-helix (wHTH) protein/TolB-like protein